MPPTNNNTPIVTETKVKKIGIDKDLATRLAEVSDDMGAAGYQLSSTFVLDTQLVCVFQRTR